MKKILIVLLIMSTLFLTGANVRWKDKADIVTLAAGDRMPVTDISAANVDKYFTPAEMYTYIMGNVSTTERDILDGATVTTAELNILDGLGASTAELNILDGATVTKDEINLLDSGEDITVYATGTTSLWIKVNTTLQCKFLDGSFRPIASNYVDLGSVGERFKDLYTAGTTRLSGVLALDGTPQDVTDISTVINATTSRTNVETGAGALAMTISNGNYEGQLKYVCMIKDGGGTVTLTGANLAGTSIAMDNVGEGFTLVWDDTLDLWFIVGNNDCTFTA